MLHLDVQKIPITINKSKIIICQIIHLLLNNFYKFFGPKLEEILLNVNASDFRLFKQLQDR